MTNHPDDAQPNQSTAETPAADSAQAPAAPARRGRGGLATLLALIALIALGVAGYAWYAMSSESASARQRGDELRKLQQRLSVMEDRLQRDREDLVRLNQKLGGNGLADVPLADRVGKLEDALAQLPEAGAQVRLAWQLAQAEYYLRVANAQQNLAGDSGSALTALVIADEYLRDAADPRLSAVRKLLAEEITALRAMPAVDTEGLVLRLGAIAARLPSMPRREVVPSAFASSPAPTVEGLGRWQRLTESLRNALVSVVSVRRTDAPVAPLMSEEAVGLLVRSMDLELQMARLALLRNESALFRQSVDRVRASLEQFFDTGAAPVSGAIATLGEMAAVAMAEEQPDISGSLTELLRFRERESRQ